MSGGHGEKRSRQRERAIAALLIAPTIEEAAKIVGVAESTLRRWHDDPGFAAAYRKERNRLVDAAIATMQAVMAEAVAELRTLLKSGPPAQRIQAARTIIDRAIHGVERDDFLERLEALEELVSQGDGEACG